MILSLLFALAVQTSDTQNAPPPPQPAPAPAPAPTTGNADDNRRICRTTQATGTRLGGRRICRTAAEWRRSIQNTQEGMRETQRDSQPTVPAPGIGG
jgi:hypothetical protein